MPYHVIVTGDLATIICTFLHAIGANTYEIPALVTALVLVNNVYRYVTVSFVLQLINNTLPMTLMLEQAECEV